MERVLHPVRQSELGFAELGVVELSHIGYFRELQEVSSDVEQLVVAVDVVAGEGVLHASIFGQERTRTRIL